MKKLTQIALAVALLAANGIAATNASAARGISIANFGHSFGGGRYFPPEPTLRRHARVIPVKPPSVNGYRGPNGPVCYTVYEPPGACEVWAHGTPHGYVCVICN